MQRLEQRKEFAKKKYTHSHDKNHDKQTTTSHDKNGEKQTLQETHILQPLSATPPPNQKYLS